MDYVISCYSKCPVHFGCSIVRQSQFDQSFDLEHALFHVWNMDLSLNFSPFFLLRNCVPNGMILLSMWMN